MSVFAVFQEDVNAGDNALFGTDDLGWDRFCLLNFDRYPVIEWGVSNGSGAVSMGTKNTSPRMMSLMYDVGASNGSYVGLDGNTSPTTFTEGSAASAYTNFAIGAINQKCHSLNVSIMRTRDLHGFRRSASFCYYVLDN